MKNLINKYWQTIVAILVTFVVCAAYHISTEYQFKWECLRECREYEAKLNKLEEHLKFKAIELEFILKDVEKTVEVQELHARLMKVNGNSVLEK